MNYYFKSANNLELKFVENNSKINLEKIELILIIPYISITLNIKVQKNMNNFIKIKQKINY